MLRGDDRIERVDGDQAAVAVSSDRRPFTPVPFSEGLQRSGGTCAFAWAAADGGVFDFGGSAR